jgi:hypothetical protein
MRCLKMPPTAVNPRENVMRTIHTARRETRYIPLMARSSMLCGMDDRVKHACTVGYSIPPITSGFLDRQALAIRCVSPSSSQTSKQIHRYQNK